MLLFKFYIVYSLKTDIENFELEEELFSTYQNLLFKFYIDYSLKTDIENFLKGSEK